MEGIFKSSGDRLVDVILCYFDFEQGIWWKFELNVVELVVVCFDKQGGFGVEKGLDLF